MPHSSTSHETKAIDELLTTLIDTHNSRYGLGAMTCSVYDTAWVSVVTKTVVGVPQYLFPSSFIAVLQAQLPDGSWDGHFKIQQEPKVPSLTEEVSPEVVSSNLADRILSTMAALYAMNLHDFSPLQIPSKRLPQPNLRIRISTAVSSLKRMLALWRVDVCKAVGFEVLCPTLLGLLDSQGYSFDFPAKSTLLHIRAAKLARVSPKAIYKHAPSALIHSLEAFHDWSPDDFDVSKVKHHMIGGSMMASPAATASYLIKTPVWDEEAEAYLRVVIECGEGMGMGAVPSAYPSTNFEFLWVVSTLAEYRVLDCIAGTEKLSIILTAIENARSDTNGLVGFAPGIEPDLDDSAKASIVLSLAGKSGFSSSIVKEFDAATCLKTYRGERDPSVSANCNALMSLLLDPHEYVGKSAIIEKIVDFIFAEWAASKGKIKDKWNLSPYYSMMLITKALAKVLTMFQCGHLPQIASTVIETQLQPLLVDCLQQTCQAQQPNGSWGVVGPYEETSYTVLTLINLAGLSLFSDMRHVIDEAQHQGRQFLLSKDRVSCEYLWIEKITYGSQFLVDAYMLSALHAKPEAPHINGTASG